MFQSTRLRRQISGQPEIKIAPLIDMVFILLIFFIVTTSFISQSGLRVEQTRARTARALEPDALLVGLGPSGELYVEGHRVDFFSLRNVVQQQRRSNPDLSVAVVADKAASAEAIVRVMDELRLAGVEKLALGTQKKD